MSGTFQEMQDHANANYGPDDEPDNDNEYDDEPEDEYDPGEECGRWLNGRLDLQCRLAGTEWCDWECPYSR